MYVQILVFHIQIWTDFIARSKQVPEMVKKLSPPAVAVKHQI